MDCWQPLEGTRTEARDRCFFRASSRIQSCSYFDTELLGSWSVKEDISVVLSHLACGTLLRQPQETNMDT